MPDLLPARYAEHLPEVSRKLQSRFPDEPYRWRLAAIAERLRRTRAHLTGNPAPLAGRYPGPEVLLAEVAELQAGLVDAGIDRSAWGELQDFRWQLETFGFHLASLEVRQHSRVLAGALEALESGDLERELAPGVVAAEVVASLRAIAAIQVRFGERACHRFVISFTIGVGDVRTALELARRAGSAVCSRARGAVR